MNEVDPTLAEVLKEWREAQELTQEEVAYAAGLTASALSRIERGLNSPGWMTVRAIAEALDSSVSEIAAEVERRESA